MKNGDTPDASDLQDAYSNSGAAEAGVSITSMDRPLQDTCLDSPPKLGSNSTISAAVDPVALVITECITVTSAMRKHARWAHSSVSAILGGTNAADISGPSTPSNLSLGKGGQWNGPPLSPNGSIDAGLVSRWGLRGRKGRSMQDNPLMAAFARLRSDLSGCTGAYQSSIVPYICLSVKDWQESGSMTHPPSCTHSSR